MIQHVIKCPICDYDFTHIDYGNQPDLTQLKELFKEGTKFALYAHCEADKHVFMMAIGGHKGQIQIEVMPIFDEEGKPLIWEE